MTLHAVQPILGLARFAESLRTLSWFAVVGQPLSADEQREALDYLAAIGIPDATVEGVSDWRAAEAATRDTQWSRAWWDAEERERAGLLDRAGKAHGQHALMSALSRVTLEASGVVLGAASIAASRSGIADPALARVAAGAATQAAYQALRSAPAPPTPIPSPSSSACSPPAAGRSAWSARRSACSDRFTPRHPP